MVTQADKVEQVVEERECVPRPNTDIHSPRTMCTLIHVYNQACSGDPSLSAPIQLIPLHGFYTLLRRRLADFLCLIALSNSKTQMILFETCSVHYKVGPIKVINLKTNNDKWTSLSRPSRIYSHLQQRQTSSPKLLPHKSTVSAHIFQQKSSSSPKSPPRTNPPQKPQNPPLELLSKHSLRRKRRV